MHTRLLLIPFLFTACSHANQVKETMPTTAAKPQPIAPEPQTTPVVTTASKPTATPEVDPSRQPIYFDFDESVLSASDQGILRQIGDWMLGHQAAALTISGHADERGTVEYNLALGDRRATTAAEYLRRLGIDPARLKTISYGKLRPAVEGHDEASWAKNRRDEFELHHGAKDRAER